MRLLPPTRIACQKDILNLAQAYASLYKGSLSTLPNSSKDVTLAVEV